MEIFGAIIALSILILIFAAIRQLSAGEIFDTITPGLILLNIFLCLGQYHAREGFGEYTDSFLAMELPLDAVRISDVTARMRNHIEVVDGVRMIHVHPLFLYELIFCILLLAGIILFSKNKEFDGELFLIYLAGYSFIRFVLEGFRVEEHFIPGTQMPAMRVLSFLFLIGAIILFVYTSIHYERQKFRRVRQSQNRKPDKNGRNLFREK